MGESVVGKDKRYDPFIKVTRDVVFNEENGLTNTDIGVFCAICLYLHNHTRKGWPSHETLAKKARVSDRTVRRSIKRLEEAGYIEVEERSTKFGRATNIYHAVDTYKSRTKDTQG